ncbi:MAG: nuclear transport factor 2 family protein [Rhodococcus sp. (in: high G+C Gram-positive bacteria)]
MNRIEDNPAFQTLMRFYDAETAYLAPGGGDFAPIAATLDPECALHVPESLAYGGDYYGPAGYEEWSKAFRDEWAALEVRSPKFIAQEDVVIVVAHCYATAKATGNDVDWPLVQLFKVRENKILELSAFYWDTAAVKAAMTA